MTAPLPPLAPPEAAQEMMKIQQEIGAAMRYSYRSVPLEPLPQEFTALLARMAVAEALQEDVDELPEPAPSNA